jgi:DUF971 family protein
MLLALVLRFAVMSAPYPTEIRRLVEVRRLRVTWSDGHVGEFDYDYLRGYCPCAACQGHAVSEIEYKPPEVSVHPSRIEPVGNYAVSILWSDSHATGIYRFDFLRQICPCEECSHRRRATEAARAGKRGEGDAS